jgi:hypothetical protein
MNGTDQLRASALAHGLAGSRCRSERCDWRPAWQPKALRPDAGVLFLTLDISSVIARLDRAIQ